MTQIEIDNLLNPVRGQVINISRLLPTGSQYFTVDAKDVDKTYKERKEQISANPTSPDIITNRGPRVVVLRGHNVVTQHFDQDTDGSTVVVFNKGMGGEETRAAIVAGNTPFGLTTDDAMKDAIRGEATPIFADGIKTCTKANVLNQNELERWIAEGKRIERYCDTIRSAIAANKKLAEDYKAQMSKINTNNFDMTEESGSVVVTVDKD